MASGRAARIAIVGLALALAGCTLLPARQRSERPSARYAAAAGVELHRSPDASSEVVGKLGLHEGVLRYQSEGGFSYVTSEKSGRAGWVREGELIERLPVAAKPPPASAPPAPEPEPEVAPEPPPPPAEKSVFDPY